MRSAGAPEWRQSYVGATCRLCRPALVLGGVNLPGGAGTHEEVSEQFLQRFRSEIPQDHFEIVPSNGKGKWFKHLNFARYDLKNIGFIRARARRMADNAGRAGLARSQDPDATRAFPLQRRKSASASARELGSKADPIGSGCRTIQHHVGDAGTDTTDDAPGPVPAKSGGIYDRIRREERRKAITPVNERSWRRKRA